eukprot:m.52968 g.52968  ORF g.52968 m.52968 type:complete len:62 (-) comp21683_c0_seq3:623-808(-)
MKSCNQEEQKTKIKHPTLIQKSKNDQESKPKKRRERSLLEREVAKNPMQSKAKKTTMRSDP